MAKTNPNQAKAEQMNTSNAALHSALCSAHRRGLLDDEPSFDVARKVSIAASHYYKLSIGQMTEAECQAAVQTAFDWQPKPKSPIF